MFKSKTPTKLLKFFAWIKAARLRTLPLSVSGVIVGTTLANFNGSENLMLFVLALLTTISFQITSNFANDYGDGVKGIDNDERVGPKRALQSGLLSRTELKNGIFLSVGICLILIIALVYFAFGTEQLNYFVLFVILGLASIWAAIKYTIGKTAYGYKGFGDIYVFVFFGLLAVLGTMFLYTKFIDWYAVLPAISIGLMSVGVLNLNNLRDYDSDKKYQKNTLIVKVGIKRGKQYHYFIMISAFLSFLVFTLLTFQSIWHFLPLLAFIPVFFHLKKVYATTKMVVLDPELKKIALFTFALALLFFICYSNFL